MGLKLLTTEPHQQKEKEPKMKRIIKQDTNPKEDPVANEIISTNRPTLEEKLDEARSRFAKIKDDIPVEEREEFLNLALEFITLRHESPWLNEMEEYQKTRFTENITFEMSIPSGKIVICDELEKLFPLSEEINTREGQWRMILHPERTHHYESLNIGYAPTGEIYPHTIINSHGDVLFDYLPVCQNDEEEFVDGDKFDGETYHKESLAEGEILTGHVSRSYEMHVVDYDAWIQAGGDKEELISKNVWEAEEYEPVVIPVTPGRYRFTSYSSNDVFWEQGDARFDNSRGSVAKLELIEAY